jgi:hypothetical protein
MSVKTLHDIDAYTTWDDKDLQTPIYRRKPSSPTTVVKATKGDSKRSLGPRRPSTRKDGREEREGGGTKVKNYAASSCGTHAKLGYWIYIACFFAVVLLVLLILV